MLREGRLILKLKPDLRDAAAVVQEELLFEGQAHLRAQRSGLADERDTCQGRMRPHQSQHDEEGQHVGEIGEQLAPRGKGRCRRQRQQQQDNPCAEAAQRMSPPGTGTLARMS